MLINARKKLQSCRCAVQHAQRRSFFVVTIILAIYLGGCTVPTLSANHTDDVTAQADTGVSAAQVRAWQRRFQRGLGAYRRGNFEAAMNIWRPLAEAGHVYSQLNVGYLYHQGQGVPQDADTAVAWYQRAAAQGSKKATFNLALMYRFGEGVPTNSERAAQLYTEAATSGLRPAQTNLGHLYRDGEGVEPSEEQAARWYSLAAEQGDPEAQTNLAYALEQGVGVTQNLQAAARWYARAAIQGDSLAQFNLGAMFARGAGVEKNKKTAYAWFTLCANQQGPDAERYQALLAQDMTPAEVEAAEELASRISVEMQRQKAGKTTKP